MDRLEDKKDTDFQRSYPRRMSQTKNTFNEMDTIDNDGAFTPGMYL